MEHLLPKFVLNDSTFAIVVDILVTKFDLQLLPKILTFLKTSPELALTRLSSESSPQSIWLRLMLSDEVDDIELSSLAVHHSHLGFPLKQRVGKFTSKDVETILKDPHNPLFLDSMKVVIKYLELCDQAPIESLCSILKVPLETELIDPLCNLIVKFQCMKVLSDKFHEESQNLVEFKQIQTWCDILLKLNSSEVVEFLSQLLDHSDQFWTQVSEWLAKNESILNFIRPDLIERIKSLDSLPVSFIISYNSHLILGHM